jgi:hypothetical protein
MARIAKPKLSSNSITAFVQKIIRANVSVHSLAHKINTQPRKIESALANRPTVLTHRSQLALVKLYLSEFSGMTE